LILCHKSVIGVELISLQPIETQANIINRKKANKTAKIKTAKNAINMANTLRMVINIYSAINIRINKNKRNATYTRLAQY
jgi:hypothetical protein